MTYTILLELHEDILDGSPESDKVIVELVKAKVDKVKWEIEQASKTLWIGWEELSGSITAIPWSEDKKWLPINLYEAQKIKQYTGEFEAIDKADALRIAANLLDFNTVK